MPVMPFATNSASQDSLPGIKAAPPRKWTCMSQSPGIMNFPLAATTLAPRGVRSLPVSPIA
jgi:hypothetical protein